MASQPLGVPRHLCKTSSGLFRTPHPAPAASHLQAPHTRPEAPIPARARRALPAGLGSRAWESGAGRPGTAEGAGGGLKVERRDALQGAFPAPRRRPPGPLQGGEPAGATRGPRRGQHARPDSTRARSALHGPAGPRRGLWGSESFGAVGPWRRPAPGLQLPRNRARPEAPGRCGPGPGGGARGEGRGNYVSQDAARRARGPEV